MNRYLRNRSRIRRRVRALAHGEPCAVLRGVRRCAKCGGRVVEYAMRNHPPEDLHRTHGRECLWFRFSAAQMRTEQDEWLRNYMRRMPEFPPEPIEWKVPIYIGYGLYGVYR